MLGIILFPLEELIWVKQENAKFLIDWELNKEIESNRITKK